MYSSRMRTVRCSGCLLCVCVCVCVGGVVVCPKGVCLRGGRLLLRECLPRGVSAQDVCLPGGVCPGGVSASCLGGCVHLPQWTDRRL